MKKIKNIAIIPARKNSKGYKNKNRIFFDLTANFVKKLKFLDEVIVSSNDDYLINKAKRYNFSYHVRSNHFAKSNTSIKSTFQNIIFEKKIEQSARLWLFYIPMPIRFKNDFMKAFNKTKLSNFKSICSFGEIPNKYHPYYSWKLNDGVVNFVKNNSFRRQDLPKAFYHFHYIYCIKADELEFVNDEMINKNTTPFFISNDLSQKLIEIDEPKDIKDAKKKGLL